MVLSKQRKCLKHICIYNGYSNWISHIGVFFFPFLSIANFIIISGKLNEKKCNGCIEKSTITLSY